MLLVGGSIDKVLLALFTPEVGLLHVGTVNGGEGGPLIFHGLLVANDVMALAIEVVDERGVIAEVGTACKTLILVDMQQGALVVYKSLKGREWPAVLVTVRAEAVTGSLLVSLSGGRIGEHLQARRTCMMSDSEVRGAVALYAEELAWTDGAPEVVRCISTLVGEVDHDSLEWFGLADSSRHVLVGLQLSISCEELTAIAANRVAMLDSVGAQRCLRTERGVAEALVWRHGDTGGWRY